MLAARREADKAAKELDAIGAPALPALPSAPGLPTTDPASAQATTAIQGTPITSVWIPITSTAANAAASHGYRRATTASNASDHPTNTSPPSSPVSTPSSVYVDSPACGWTFVRSAVTPAFPRP